MSIGIFTLPLAANEVREVDITGEYFELRNALSPVVLIELLDRTGGVVARLDNPEQSDFVRPGRYEKVRITNGAVAQTVRHFYGSGDAGSRRTSGLVQVEGVVSTTGTVTVAGTVATSGTTSVVDGGKARTLASVAFSGVALGGVVAGQQSRVQLWNPAGSGKRAIVEQVILGSGFVNSLYLQNSTVALATLLAEVPLNKLIAGTAGAIQLRKDNIAAPPSGGAFALVGLPANSSYTYKLSEPIVLEPGRGLLVWASGAATDVYSTFEFFEEAYP